MKALMIKDINLLKGQKQFLGAVLIILVMFTFMQNNATFSITYVTVMFSILTITTMGYDDFENGMCFLMTLPVSRKEYVREKYIFGILTSLCGFAASSVFVTAAAYVRGGSYLWEEWLTTAAACVLIIDLVLAVTMPIQLKFGSEKSRMAMLGVYAAGCVIVFVAVKLCEAAGIDIGEVVESVFVEKLTTTVWGIGIISAAVLLASYLISAKILEKREF